MDKALNITFPLSGRTTEATIKHIIRIVSETYPSVSNIAKSLKGSTDEMTFENIVVICFQIVSLTY